MQINNEVYLFKYLYTKEQRLTWSEEARTKYPNKFPIIVEKDHKCQTIDDLQNPKFLMPKAFEISEVQTIIRRKLKLKKEQGLFLMCQEGKELLKANSKLNDVFNKFKD